MWSIEFDSIHMAANGSNQDGTLLVLPGPAGSPPVLTPAPIPLLDWRQFSSSKCPGLARRLMRPAMMTRQCGGIRYFSELFSEAYSCVTALQAPATRSDGRYTALYLRRISKVLTRASSAAALQVKLPALDPSAAIEKEGFRHPFTGSKICVLSVDCNTAGSGWSQYSQSSIRIQGVAGELRP